MSRTDCNRNPSGVSSVEKRKEISTKSAADRIRQASEILKDLLVDDDLVSGILLIGPVSESLNEVVMELDNLSGLQNLFEMWITAA